MCLDGIPWNAGCFMSLTETQLHHSDVLSDRTLLRRFVLDGDESAFGEIVQRHSGLVMSVCFRVTGQQSDADDAFQATFLALAQRPAGIDNVLSLAGWLYSVAWRTSVRVVRLRRRRMMEALPAEPAAQDSDPLKTIAEASDLAALDEELNELPQKYRDVLVMNYLAQQTSQQIADQLNESKGAVDGRLREAKRLLRVRLARRGVEVGALTVAASLTQSAVAAPTLIAKTQALASVVAGTSGAASAYTTQELLKLKTLSSAGATIMTTKITLAVTAGCAMLIGGLGMSRLDAFPTGSGQEPVVALDARAEGGDEVNAGGATVAGPVEGPSQEGAAAGGGGASGGPGASGGGLAAGPVGQEGAGSSRGGGVPGQSGSVVGALPPGGSAGLASGMPGMGGPGAGMMGASGMGADGAGMSMGAGMGPIAANSNLAFARSMDRTAESQMIRRLGTEQSPELSFAGEQPLATVLSALSTHLETRIVIDTKDPSGELSASSLSEIMVRDIEIPQGTMSIAAVLDEILSKSESVELTWIVRNGQVVITTEEGSELPENLILHSYDISALRDLQMTTPQVPAMPAGGLGGGGGGFGSVADPQMGMGAYAPSYSPTTSLNPQETPPGAGAVPGGMPPGMGAPGGMSGGGMGGMGVGLGTPAELTTWEARTIAAIIDLTSPPCMWVQNGEQIGTMVVVGNRLVVRQTRKGHQLVSEAIEQLEEAAKSRTPVPPNMGAMGGGASVGFGGGVGPWLGSPGMGAGTLRRQTGAAPTY